MIALGTRGKMIAQGMATLSIIIALGIATRGIMNAQSMTARNTKLLCQASQL